VAAFGIWLRGYHQPLGVASGRTPPIDAFEGGCPTSSNIFSIFKKNNNFLSFIYIYIFFIMIDTCRYFIDINVAPNRICQNF
jgi:hypothetical protein